MDWVPVVTAGITAGATLGGVAVTQAFAKNARESNAVRLRRQDEATVDLRTEARHVSDLFYSELVNCDRIQRESRNGTDFDTLYVTHLYNGALTSLTQAISMIPNADARSQLQLIVRNLTDRETFALTLLGIDLWAPSVAILLNTGAEVSSAYARGETPDLDGSKWFRRIETASAIVDEEIARARARHPSELGKHFQQGATEN